MYVIEDKEELRGQLLIDICEILYLLLMIKCFTTSILLPHHLQDVVNTLCFYILGCGCE